ncbi:signal transduction histidine kinase [Hamadaea flava]|uniref:histidine kinase n=1 Tax=Hamadaea flava TaxID=1742688 RepID=A0ABV8LTK7_9ACTN|nr:HAMP domain-containing sensor histidine kinase [Hamadaea flava]MCP2328332.1 signal transduction histidine kinase [Hamadaea flava]
MKPTIRLRLTLAFAVLLLGTCATVLAINDALLYNSLYAQISGPSQEQSQPKPTSAPQNDFSDDLADKDARKAQALAVQQALVTELRAGALRSAAGPSAIALAVAGLLGLGICWLVAGRMLRPLRTLTAATRRISQDRLHERIALTGPRDELKELADTFDEMVTRLEASFTSQRRFVADAAHELRTPLAIVRTGAEVQLARRDSTPAEWEASARRVLSAAGRAERLLDGLLALARSDSGVLAAEPHDLAVAAATALADADDEAEQAALTITSDLRPAPVVGDPPLLDRLVANLIYNAVRHNHDGGWVAVTSTHDEAEVSLTVSNSGAIVPAADVDRLFEPFQRLPAQPATRPAAVRSTGLGLAIVRSIVRAHRGAITATPNDGGGLTVVVRLPVHDHGQFPVAMAIQN